MMSRAVLLLSGLLVCSAAPAQETLVFTTEAYPPFSFRAPDGTSRGAGVDQVSAMMAEIGQPYRIEIMPWARAIALAETQPMHCVFAAARTPERETRFKWVIPLFVDRAILVARDDSAIGDIGIDEAKTRLVGTHRADYTETLLHTMGFANIDVSADFETNVRKLIEKRIELMPMSEGVFADLKARGTPLREVTTLSLQPLGLACHLSLPDSLVARLQGELDRLVKSGEQDRILSSYGVVRPR